MILKDLEKLKINKKENKKSFQISENDDFNATLAISAEEKKYLQDLMDKNDLKECLTNIYYLPFLISNNYMTDNNYNGSA